MRALRQPFVQRLVSFGLLLSLGCWLAVPASATPSLARDLGLSGGLSGEWESVLTEALGASLSAEAFVERLAATLADGEEAEALADVLEADPDALLALLYGHLFQALGTPTGLSAVPAGSAPAAVGAAPYAKDLPPRAAEPTVAPRTLSPTATAPRAARLAVSLTAAQPLGP